MRDASELGARRVSVGGTFDELKQAASYDELQRLFAQP